MDTGQKDVNGGTGLMDTGQKDANGGTGLMDTGRKYETGSDGPPGRRSGAGRGRGSDEGLQALPPELRGGPERGKDGSLRRDG